MALRLIQLLRRRADLSAEAFAARWRDEHGPLVASLQTTLDIVRHVQLHRDPFGGGIDAAAAQARGGMEPPFDGIAETWWASAEHLAAALGASAGKAAAARLVESERSLVDLAASPLWFAADYPQVATTLRRPVAHVRSPIMRLHFALRQHGGMSDAEARRYWLEDHGPLIRSHAPARGLMAYNQVHRRECELLEVFTGPRGTACESYLGHAESWFERLAGSTPPQEMQAAMDAAIADERRFIDWDRSTIFVGKELVFVDREWA